jgi:hypothetical protein
VFPVRYALDSYILFGRNSVFKGLANSLLSKRETGRCVKGSGTIYIEFIQVLDAPLLLITDRRNPNVRQSQCLSKFRNRLLLLQQFRYARP